MANEKWGKGNGLKIAHIDSGINEWHPHIGKVAGGVAFKVGNDGKIVIEQNFEDQLGHGTAVAGVIKEQVPEAKIWAVKIFHDRLSAYIEVLCAAIEWCIDNQMDLINLSLGVNKDVEEFRFICEKACEAGIMIITACDEKNGLYWPGYYESVYAVQASDQVHSEMFYYHEKEKIQLQTLGFPRSLEGPMQKFNFQGHSFAAAHMTGFIAKMMEKQNIQNKEQLDKFLNTNVVQISYE